MQKIYPSLWFSDNAEEAVNFYVSIFENSKINDVMRYDAASAEASGQPEGSVLSISFELLGQKFLALNGGPIFTFNEAVSFVVECKDQEEIDYFWSKLTEGGDEKAQRCGWLKDKYGLSWQIVPENMGQLIGGDDPEKAKRAMNAMLQMKKIEIRELEEA